MSSNQPLNPDLIYNWSITVQGPIGGGRGVSQEHWGLYRVPPGQTKTSADVMEQLRKECAQKMGLPIAATTVIEFRLSA